MITQCVNSHYSHILEFMSTTLGEYIKGRRNALGMNQTQFADASGVQRAHLSQIESGKIALPNADMRRRIASALGVSHLDLLVAAGEITEDEAGGVRDVDSPAVSALRPVLDSYDGDVDMLVRVIRGIIDL